MRLHLKMLLTGIYLCFVAEQTIVCSQSLSNLAETKSLIDNRTMDEINQHSDLVLDDASSHSWGTSALVAGGLGLAAVGAGLGLAYYNSPKTSKIIESPKTLERIESPKTSELIQVYSNGTQIIDVFNNQSKLISRSVINSSGVTTTFDGALLTAWHEAGHAVAAIENDSLVKVMFIRGVKASLIKNVHNSIFSSDNDTADGLVDLGWTHPVVGKRQEVENQGIIYLCGVTAEQVAMSQQMFTESLAILELLSDWRLAGDVALARLIAQTFLKQTSPALSEEQMAVAIDQTLVDWYKKGYAFVIEKKADIQKLAHVLVEKQKLPGYEVYNILDADMPLFDFEEGPLPVSLIKDYQLRGWPKPDTLPRAPLYDYSSVIDPRRDKSSVAVDGVKTGHRYYFNGNKAVEIVIHPDKSSIKIEYDSHGIPEKKTFNTPMHNTIITHYNSDGSAEVSTFASDHTLLSEEHIPAPSTKIAPEHQVADTNTEQVKDAAEVKDF